MIARRTTSSRSLCDFVGSLLLADYDIHVAFTEYNRNVIRWSRLWSVRPGMWTPSPTQRYAKAG
jgi:hypothetical protein